MLQTSFYSHLLAGVQKVEPRWMHLALGDGEFASFKVDDFAAYERQTRRLPEEPHAPHMIVVGLVERGDERSRVAQDHADSAPPDSPRSGYARYLS